MPYVEVDGRMLHYRQKGSGPVALFVHGFPLNSTMWLDQLEGLAGRRCCIAPDLRGFGLSAPVTGEPITMENHAGDLVGLLDRLEVDEVDLVGLSMGGYIALAFAEGSAGRLRSLALVDTRAGADSPEGRIGRDAAIEHVLTEGRGAFADERLTALLSPTASPAARARLRSMIEMSPYEAIVAGLAGMGKRPDRTGVLAEVTVPAVVIVGADDTTTPPSLAKAMAAALPDAKLHIIEDAGHMTPIERPEAVNNALAGLFDRVNA